MKRFVYADNAATTRLSPAVLDAMLPWLTEGYGNPSSIYSKGREAAQAVLDARRRVAAILGCDSGEVYFTSGGSEADNWAIKGTAHRLAAQGKKHLVTTVFEHHAVLHTCAALEKEGFSVTYLPVGEKGIVSPQAVEAALREDTALVSIMAANNEIGTIQPIAQIGALCRERGVLFHTDAVQAVCHLDLDVRRDNIDLLSLSAHKIHGPKGSGVLYARKGTVPWNLIDGGGQERGKRAGTENVAGIVGTAAAMELAHSRMGEELPRIAALRDRLIEGALQIPCTRLNGDRERRLPGNVNLSIEGIEGEALLLKLDARGICASSGSACTSGSLDPSHVLLAIGLPHEVAHGSLRLSLSEENTSEDVDYILEVLPQVVEELRAMSPVWERMKAEGRC